jgi:surface antigen
LSETQASNVTLTQKILSKSYKIKLSKSHLPTFRSFTIYAGVFSLLISAVGYSYHFSDSSNISTISTTTAGATRDGAGVDEVTALQIAGTIAKRADLPVAANITNLAVSMDAQNKISQSDAAIVNKPKIIDATANNRSIEVYAAKDGDTVQSIAEQFGVSDQTIKWANNLTADAIESGSNVTIPPVDGVVYNVKDGDTVASLADKYKSPTEQIVSFNDLELSGIKTSQQIILPGGTLPIEEQPGYVAPAMASIGQNNLTGGAPSAGSNSTSGLVNGYTAINMTAAGNAYAFGNCTSWAYERRAQLGHPVGSYWGNAATWDSLGRAAGYIVNKTPTVGAVYQMPAFVDAYTGVYGHVGIVEGVNPDGSIYISEMNYAGNFNRVTYRTIPAAQAALYNYIH